jgi:hypothetical protein
LLALALTAGPALALGGCGGSDAKLLPGPTADEITENLDSVQRLADEGECVGAEDAALQVSTQVQEVSGIDPKLKTALENGAARLNEVVAGCEEEEPEETEKTVASPTQTPSKAQQKEEEEAAKEAEKEEKEAEKAEEKAEKEAEKEAETEAPPPSLPPQANGEAKGHVEEPPAEPGPSGGIGPGSEVKGED